MRSAEFLEVNEKMGGGKGMPTSEWSRHKEENGMDMRLNIGV